MSTTRPWGLNCGFVLCTDLDCFAYFANQHIAQRNRNCCADMDLQLRPERDTEAASPHTVLQQAERYERFETLCPFWCGLVLGLCKISSVAVWCFFVNPVLFALEITNKLRKISWIYWVSLLGNALIIILPSITTRSLIRYKYIGNVLKAILVFDYFTTTNTHEYKTLRELIIICRHSLHILYKLECNLNAPCMLHLIAVDPIDGNSSNRTLPPSTIINYMDGTTRNDDEFPCN